MDTQKHETREKQLEHIQAILQENGYFTTKSIDTVNHHPHIYMITEKHVEYCSNNYSMYLTEDAIREAERYGKAHCGHPNCRIPYDEHTYDTVVFLQLTRNLTNQEAKAELMKLTGYMVGQGIDGFSFVDTPEHYRIN